MTNTQPRSFPRGKYAKPIRFLDDGVDRAKLRSVIKTRGETQTRLARAYGKDPASISNKLSGRSPFRKEDIDFLFDYLRLNPALATEIFFAYGGNEEGRA